VTRETLWVVLVLSAPWALVLVVALVRGYDLTVTLTRRGRQGPEE
jgi:hypothetical protein